jgi:hypothetical protein
MKLKFLPIIIIFVIWIIGVSISKYFSLHQKNISVDLIITDIERTPTNQLLLYNDGSLINLSNYTFMNYDDIKIGDSISKKENEDKLYFYRKNLESRKYQEKLMLLPN